METLKERLSIIRKYPVEFILIILVASTGYLFKKTETNSENFSSYLINDQSKLIKVIENNTETLKFFIIKNGTLK